MKFKLNIIIISSILFFAFGCKTKRALLKQEQLSISKASEALQKVNENSFNFEWLKAKIKTKYDASSGENRKFSTLLKIRKDSVIWAGITYANLPIATFMLTPDSLKYLNRIDKRYFVGGYNFINQKINYEITFSQIQDILVGNVLNVDTTKTYYLVEEEKKSYISSVKEKEIKKIISKLTHFEGLVYRYWINQIYKSSETIINYPEKNAEITIIHDGYKKIEGQYFPDEISADFKSGVDSVSVKIKYEKIAINEPTDFPFSLNKKYKQYE